MRLKEQRLWDRMRRAVGGEVRLERVENVVAVGMPDVVALFEGRSTWIENKAVEDYPARPTTRVLGNTIGLSRDQMNWHHDWHRWGGKSIIVVAVGLDVYAFDGALADHVNSMTKEEMEAAAFARDFPRLITFLKTHI
jgi:hypothetical protein